MFQFVLDNFAHILEPKDKVSKFCHTIINSLTIIEIKKLLDSGK